MPSMRGRLKELGRRQTWQIVDHREGLDQMLLDLGDDVSGTCLSEQTSLHLVFHFGGETRRVSSCSGNRTVLPMAWQPLSVQMLPPHVPKEGTKR